MDSQITLYVSDEFAGTRLDKFISESRKEISRSHIKKLIEENQILLNNKPSKPSYKIRFKDEILINLPEPEELKIKPEEIKLDVIYEDKDLIVINKPQGMITHPASGIYKGTLVNALLYHCKDSLSGINGVLRPGIVHRLDKDTSGLIIACKNDKSHKEIAKQIKERKVKRSYLAIVHRKVQYDKGTINKPIGRHKVHRGKMAVVPNGRQAITHFKILKRFDKYTLLECSLETGRTHQIRVHMSSIGHPIVGDKIYGKKEESEMMLHAYKLIFIHPRTKKEIKLEIGLPERFKNLTHHL